MTVHIVKAPAGLGKTSEIINQIAASKHQRVEFYVPTLNLAKEIKTKFEEAGVGARVMIGRSNVDSTKITMCRKPELAAEVSKLGYPVFPVICMGQATPGDRFSRGVCEHFGDCNYLKQFEAHERVLIFTHAYLPLPRNNKETKAPSLVVIDESFLSVCLETHELPRETLIDAVHDADKANTREIANTILKACDDKLPILKAARTAIPSAVIKLAAKEVAATGASFNATDSDSAFLTKLQKFGRARLRIDILIEVLAAELLTVRTESHGITFDYVKQVLRVHHRKPILRFKTDGMAPDIIIIDANADRQLIEPWFPGAKFQDIPASRKAYVTQCSSTRASTASFVPSKHEGAGPRQKAENQLAGLQELVNRECNDDIAKLWLIVGPQAITGNAKTSVPALLTCPSNARFAHFNGLRGVDAYKDFDGVILIGRNQPAIKGLEDMARALWFDSAEPLIFATEWVVEERAYQMRDSTHATGIEVEVHPDPRIQRLHEQIREGESTQAIDRLRLIHPKQQKRVIIVSNVPLDIEVDELRSFDHIVRLSRLQQALADMSGVLPLNPMYLAENFPHLWPTAAAAKKDVTREIQKGQFVNSISINDLSLLIYQYRVVGQRKPSRAISIHAVDTTLHAITLDLQRPIILRPLENGIPGLEVFSSIGRAEMQCMTSDGIAVQTEPAMC